MNCALLDRSKGKFYFSCDLLGEDDIPDSLRENDTAVEMPHKNDLDLGQSLIFKFIDLKLPSEYDYVSRIFRKRGSYSRYHGFLESKGLLEEWYKFENEAEEKALRDWCKDENIELID
jgi:hypothetical protein